MTYCFPSVNELSEKLSYDFLHCITDASPDQKIFNIALSGGKTPEAFFEKIAANPISRDNQTLWKRVRFFWVDERCVPPDHADSNFSMTNESLFSKIGTGESNVHRIYGENDPYLEATRYAKEIKQFVELLNGIPVFDWIFLGVGDDGHTASIFPGRLDLMDTDEICAAVVHPVTGQFRITLTGKTILQAKRITFMVTGESKSKVLREILNNEAEALSYPAAQILWHSNNTDWFIDEAAAKYLNIMCRGKY
jgi:6-phosphogluconolactonase